MPRYRRSNYAQILTLVLVVVLVIARWQGWTLDGASPLPGGTASPGGAQLPGATSVGLRPGIYEVERAVDGDTLLLRAHGRVRLQGVDAPEIPHEGHPETDPWGPEAKSFMQEFIRDAHHRVRIEVDGEGADHYGRWLAFVWNGDRLLNEDLVRNGFARAKLGYDYSQQKKDLLRRAQSDAQRAGVGIWESNEAASRPP
jgi:endonuclease YncB( thermonuclease family)